MRMIQKLRSIVEQNCISKDGNASSMNYWSEVIFAKCLLALIPFSLLALIPAVIICLDGGFYWLLGFDVFIFLMLICVGFVPGISVAIRKTILIFLIFLAAFILLLELGSFGPGLVYLLAATVFMLLLFPNQNPKLPFALTLIFCFSFGVIIHLELVQSSLNPADSVMAWIAVSSNVVFLSAMLTLLIPFFFSKLDSTITEKLQVLESLRLANLELEKSIAEVKSKNAVLEEFAFVASHDLQEPLRMVSSFMAKLAKSYKNQLDEKAHQCIHYATEGANRMKQIIQDLSNYSTAGKSSDAAEAVDLREMINDYQKSRKHLITEKSITVEAKSMPILVATKPNLIQTFHCLLDNASTFSRPGVPPKIKVTAEEKPAEWLFSIEDNGIGIHKQFFDKIFVIFQRLHNRDQYTGSGVGLSIAKKNTESWGGKIWLESIPEQGSIFYFTYPKNA